MPSNFHQPQDVLYILTKYSHRWWRVVDWRPTTAGPRENQFLLAYSPDDWCLSGEIRAAATAWPPRSNLVEPSYE